MDLETCSGIYSSYTHPAFLAVTFPQLVSPLCALVLMIWFCLKFFRRGDFHKNAKILMACQLIFSSIYCLSFVIVDGLLLFNVLFRLSEPCAFVFYAKDCVVVFYSITVSITGMGATQVCIGIERIVSTIYVKNYEKFGIRLGLFFATIIILLSVAVALIVLSSYNPYETRGSCLGVPNSAGDKSRLLYYVIIACDAATALLFAYTWKLNARVGVDQSHLALGVKYQRKENANVIKMLIPNVVAHGIVYGSFSTAATILRSNQASTDPLVYSVLAVFINFVPHYTLVEIGVLHWILHRTLRNGQEFKQQVSQQTRETEKDVYFANYSKLWN